MGSNRVTVAESNGSRGSVQNPKDHVVICECGTPGETGYENSALKAEAFGPVLAIVELDSYSDYRKESKNNNNHENKSNSIINYAQNVLGPFLNNKNNIYGSLSCTLMSPNSVNATVVEAVVASLRYGTVTVNCGTFMGYIAMTEGCVWGAHCEDYSRQSGNGYIGNPLAVNGVDRTVVYGQFPTNALQIETSFNLNEEPTFIFYSLVLVIVSYFFVSFKKVFLRIFVDFVLFYDEE